MPPKRVRRKVSAQVAEQPTCGAEGETSEQTEDLSDETSDSECELEAACRQIGRNAARDVLSLRSREQYTTYQKAMVSWGQRQNAALPAEKQYQTRVPFSYRFVAMYLDHLKQKAKLCFGVGI